MEAAGGPVLVDGGKGPRDGRGGADLVIDVARKDCASGHFIGEGHAEGIAVFRKRPAIFAGP